MTWRDELSPKELSVVEELKQRTTSDATPGMLKDESVFYRFAKARDFNLKNAEHMIRNHIAWRKEFRVDTILEDFTPSEILKTYIPSSFACYDKEGLPVRYVDAGKIDLKGFVHSFKPMEFIKYNIYIMEEDVRRLENQSKKLGKPVEKVCYIYNCDSVSFFAATYKKGIDWMMYGIKMYQDNYPERIKSLVMINASFYFNLLFNMLKAVVASAVIDKITMYGENGWKEDLLKQIDCEDLPAFLGGRRTDPDGNALCKTFIIHGQKVPERLYMIKSDKALSKTPGVQRTTVSRFSKADLSFQVDDAGSLLEWVFETKNRDIAFGVYYQDRKNKLEELVPKQRIDTDYEAEMGVYKCEKSGKYVIVFDNSYSWIYQKEIFYKVRVIKPDDKEYIDKVPF